MSLTIAAAGPSAYWYLSRGTGAVTLVLLSAVVVLGVLGSVRFSLGPRWPRFATDALHRDLSLLVMALLALHIATSVLDSFAPIKLTDSFIPFVGRYRPLWLGLGALSFDLLLALVVTSLLRRRFGYRAWRAIHWLAYASWPVAVLHGLGTGSDVKSWWMLALTVACVASVVLAALARVGRAAPGYGMVRAPALALAIATPLGLAIFALAGPLQHGWARRAGTPLTLLGAVARPASTPAARAVSLPRPTLHPPFTARLAGQVTQKSAPGGAIVDHALRLSGGAHGRLRVRLAGAPVDGGGLSMTGSQVDLAANGLPSVMQGNVVSLEGQQFLARVSDGSGSVFDLRANLNIDSNTGTVTGTLAATTVGTP